MQNKYGFLGFVSLLGTLGFIYDDPLYYSFFGFATFFQYFFIIPDELFIDTIKKAATYAFLGGQIVLTLSTLFLGLFQISKDPLVVGIILGWSASITIFGLSLAFLEFRQQRGLNHYA